LLKTSFIEGKRRPEENDMNIQSMEYIIALSKTLNFTKAAAAMRTTQPAFSRVISVAEEELGVLLFERSRRHVNLTQAGATLVPQLEKTLIAYEEGLRQARGVSKRYAGELKIGYIPDVINQDVRLLAESFADEYPDVGISLNETHYYELQYQLLSEELDIAVYTSMRTGFLPELAHYSLFHMPLCVVVSDQHPLAARTSVTPDDLRDEPYVVLEHDTTLSGSWSFVHRFAAEHGFTPWIVSQTSMLSSALLQVSCNKGVCIASQFAGHLAPENVRIIPIRGGGDCVRYAVWSRSRKNPALSDFVNCIQKSFEKSG